MNNKSIVLQWNCKLYMKNFAKIKCLCCFIFKLFNFFKDYFNARTFKQNIICGLSVQHFFCGIVCLFTHLLCLLYEIQLMIPVTVRTPRAIDERVMLNTLTSVWEKWEIDNVSIFSWVSNDKTYCKIYCRDCQMLVDHVHELKHGLLTIESGLCFCVIWFQQGRPVKRQIDPR